MRADNGAIFIWDLYTCVPGMGDTTYATRRRWRTVRLFVSHAGGDHIRTQRVLVRGYPPAVWSQTAGRTAETPLGLRDGFWSVCPQAEQVRLVYDAGTCTKSAPCWAQARLCN